MTGLAVVFLLVLMLCCANIAPADQIDETVINTSIQETESNEPCIPCLKKEKQVSMEELYAFKGIENIKGISATDINDCIDLCNDWNNNNTCCSDWGDNASTYCINTFSCVQQPE